MHKKDVYAKYMVKEYWIVDPMGKWIELYKNDNGAFLLIAKARKDESIISGILAGFKVALDVIFV